MTHQATNRTAETVMKGKLAVAGAVGSGARTHTNP